MRGTDQQKNHMFSYLSPETRVPKDHPLRAIRVMVDQVLAKLSRQFAVPGGDHSYQTRTGRLWQGDHSSWQIQYSPVTEQSVDAQVLDCRDTRCRGGQQENVNVFEGLADNGFSVGFDIAQVTGRVAQGSGNSLHGAIEATDYLDGFLKSPLPGNL